MSRREEGQKVNGSKFDVDLDGIDQINQMNQTDQIDEMNEIISSFVPW